MGRARVHTFTEDELRAALTDERNIYNWLRRTNRYRSLPEGACWVWWKRASSYGQFTLRVGDRDIGFGAHLVALMFKLGRPLRPEHIACHSCDVPGCANRDHVWEGTYLDNMRDAAAKGRLASNARRAQESAA